MNDSACVPEVGAVPTVGAVGALLRGRRAVLAFWALDVQVAEQTEVQVGAPARWQWLHEHDHELAAIVTRTGRWAKTRF